MSRFSGKMDNSGPKTSQYTKRKNKGVMKAYRQKKYEEAVARKAATGGRYCVNVPCRYHHTYHSGPCAE